MNSPTLAAPRSSGRKLYYEGGLEAFVRYLDRAKTPLISNPILIKGERDKITVEAALWWNDSYHEHVFAFTNNIPQRDGGTHLAGLRAALTRQVTGYAERAGLGQAREGRSQRRRLPRGSHLRAFGESSRPEIFLADQGKARVLRGAAGGRRPRQRDARGMVRGTSAGGARRRGQGRGGGAGPRSGAQGARAHPSQGRARCRQSARQARRLPGARSGEGRTASSSRAIRPAAPPSRAATGNIRPCFRCAAKSSMSSGRASTRCCRARKSGP